MTFFSGYGMNDFARAHRLKQGNPLAWNVLIDQIQPTLIKSALSILKNQSDAEDVTQIVLFRFWQKRKHLHKIQNFEHYARRAVRNEALNILRKRRQQANVSVHDAEMQHLTISHRDQPVAIAERNELVTWIGSTRQTLTERQQEIFIALQKDPNQSSRQVAVALGCSHKNVLAILGRIRKTLKKTHGGYCS